MHVLWASLVAQVGKNLPAMRETWVWSLGQEDPLEKGMANHSSILAQRILWIEEPNRLYRPWDCNKLNRTKWLTFSLLLSYMLLGRKTMTNLDSILESRDIALPTKVRLWFFWELDHKESWALRNWCLWAVVLEKAPESTLDNKELKPVNPKGNQSWIFIGRTDAEAETPILWPPDGKNWFLGKDPDSGKDWRQEETGMTEDEIVG